jgi:outer membrane protein
MNEAKSTGRIYLIVVSAMIMGALLSSGCIRRTDEKDMRKWVASSADSVWIPPPKTDFRHVPEKQLFDLPDELMAPGKKWRLLDLVEVALRNNSQTRAAWHAAQAAAADWQSKKGDYYPRIDVNTAISDTQMITSQTITDKTVRSFGSELELTWLLFDFGGRASAIEEKRQALLAADFSHNAIIQNAVYSVLEAYFQYANTKAMVKASVASFNEASVNLEAAQQRHHNGLATIADVLQAKTALSQAKLNMETMQGQVETIRGVLATAMGIPANTPYDIEDLPLNPPLGPVTEKVETYIKQARANRPDLAAQMSRVEQAFAHINTSRSALYPNLVVNNSLGASINDQTSDWKSLNSAALMLSIPLFKGYSRRYDLIKAGQDAEIQKAQMNTLEQTVVLQVWTSYFNLKTSEQRIKTSSDFMKSAEQSYDVSLGRYKEGVGGFLDLLAAQSTLEKARAERVLAQADWYISFSELARNTGTLWNRKPGDKEGIFNIFPTTTIKENQP